MSAIAAVACVTTWQADFRADFPKIDVPVLVIQGDSDRVLPFDETGKRLPGLIADMDLIVVEGGPHAIPWTHTTRLIPPCSAFSAIRQPSYLEPTGSANKTWCPGARSLRGTGRCQLNDH